MKKLATISLISLALSACSVFQTVTPTRVESHTSSFDASTPMSFADKTNSGILRFERDAHGQVTGALVTINFLNYAQSLIADYGDQVAPPMKELKPVKREDAWFIDTEALDHLQQMSRWRKSNRPKTGALTKLMNKITP